MRDDTGREQAVKRDFSAVTATPEGQRVLGNILSFCRVYEPNIDLNSHVNTAYLEGMRFVGLQLLRVLGPVAACNCANAFESFNEFWDKEAHIDGGDD